MRLINSQMKAEAVRCADHPSLFVVFELGQRLFIGIAHRGFPTFPLIVDAFGLRDNGPAEK